MNYRINFVAAASSQVSGLPADAWTALIEELLIIGADPHHRGIAHPEQPLFREQAFGTGGLVSYVVDDAAKLVHVYSIVWVS